MRPLSAGVMNYLICPKCGDAVAGKLPSDGQKREAQCTHLKKQFRLVAPESKIRRMSLRKRFRHLNGWQRIGVIVSVIWFFYGFYWGNEQGLHQGEWVSVRREVCLGLPNANFAACDQEFNRDWPVAIAHHWDYALFFGLVPIPLGWIVAYAIVAIVRWVRRGFQPSATSGTP